MLIISPADMRRISEALRLAQIAVLSLGCLTAPAGVAILRASRPPVVYTARQGNLSPTADPSTRALKLLVVMNGGEPESLQQQLTELTALLDDDGVLVAPTDGPVRRAVLGLLGEGAGAVRPWDKALAANALRQSRLFVAKVPLPSMRPGTSLLFASFKRLNDTRPRDDIGRVVDD